MPATKSTIHSTPAYPVRTIFDLIPFATFLADPVSLTVRQVNSACAQLLGYPETSMIGRDVTSLFQAGEIHANATCGPKESECIALCADGSALHVRVTMANAKLDELPALIFTLVPSEPTDTANSSAGHDMQSIQMASLGQLIPGIAHEINNPIGFVSSNIATMTEYVEVFRRLLHLYEKVLADPAANTEEKEEIESIIEEEDLAYILEDIGNLTKESADGMDRLKDIVQDLKTFARIDFEDWRQANLNQCIDMTMRLVWNELKYKCEVHKVLGDLPMIRCNPGQVNQALMNILVNAAQAIEESGDIWITSCAADGNVTISIRDSGCGIPTQDIERVFEPRFSTKGSSAHPGLGLTMAKAVVDQHGGAIRVGSSTKEGTTITLTFPMERDET